MKIFAVFSIILAIHFNDCTKINGRPVPLPQIYTATDYQYYMNPYEFKFQFVKGSYVCDVTTLAFNRYHKLIFNPHEYEIVTNRRVVQKRPVNRKKILNQMVSDDQGLLKELLVLVAEPCEEYPTLESDESCNMFFS
jgi:hypothetical protein